MLIDEIRQQFTQSVSRQVDLIPRGIDRFYVQTPFTFDDGDHPVIILRKEGERWILSDEGHTFMHLTYSIEEKDLYQGTRQRIITNVLSSLGVQDVEGEIRIAIPDEDFGNALYSFIHALLKISDVTFLTRERVKSTFMEDFRRFIYGAVSENRRAEGWHHPQRDPEGNYVVDFRVNGSTPQPLFIFALPSDEKVRDATITLHQFERWSIKGRSLGIFENQEEINRKVLARFSDVAEKLFSSLASNTDRISRFLVEAGAS
jgi:hypothetical protein